jgi:hypothetical protein
MARLGSVGYQPEIVHLAQFLLPPAARIAIAPRSVGIHVAASTRDRVISVRLGCLHVLVGQRSLRSA